ncbi:hypothetical protein QVD99_001681 [Batrachochytrium dendrobatidis]|nr:hypothetical protein O5D80_000328 [Batrachochytrium dendrobatidis]KAK5671850.1 hypothetical protein QVD99_001681 [Batrachochytrium dendrobatidis]
MHWRIATLAFVLLQTVLAHVWPLNDNGTPASGSIQTFFMSPKNLWINRQFWQQGHNELRPAIRRILRLADGAVLDATSYSVTSKNTSLLSPSNDPHYYYSLSTQFWPQAANNNSSPISGAPYAFYDGYINPEVYLYQDPQYIQVMFDDVYHCALAFFFTGNETYAQTATKRLNTWFLDPATAMKPSMEFAASIRGVDTTEGKNTFDVTTANGTMQVDATSVLMDFNKVYQLIDAIGLLRISSSFTNAHYQGMHAWMKSFYDWSQSSKRAKSFALSVNNQGTWNDVQQVSILLFLNRTEDANSIILKNTVSRMALQIASPDGSQPIEQTRQMSWFHSVHNLEALYVLGSLSRSLSTDLFQYIDPSTKQPILSNALKYLIPFAQNNGAGWVGTNIGKFDPSTVNELCKHAFIVYREESFMDAIQLLQSKPKSWNPSRLWTPYLAYDSPNRNAAIDKSTGSIGFVVAILAAYWGFASLFLF